MCEFIDNFISNPKSQIMTTFYKKRKIVERKNHDKLLQDQLERNFQNYADSISEKLEPINLQISNLLKTNSSLLKFFDASNPIMF